MRAKQKATEERVFKGIEAWAIELQKEEQNIDIVNIGHTSVGRI